jgi:predicted amidohydrolase
MNKIIFKPSSFRGKVFISLILLLSSLNLSAMTPGDELEVVVVQFEMSAEIVQSEEAYTAAMSKAMEAAMKDGDADLVIFPEYIGVFTSLIPWYDYLVTDRPFEEVWFSIQQANPEISNIKELFMREAAITDKYLNRLWGDLAREYDVYILSGSRFNNARDHLFNQAVVYSPAGKAIYRQNKYFLTDFELDIVGLSSGDIRETSGFEVKDHHINLTICRDTFLKEWETIHNNGELWIDIKANGVEYTEDQLALFTRALPARLAKTDVPYGITACLTGDFLNLFWEGESSIIYNDKGKVSYLEVSDKDDSFEIMRETFP